VEEGYRSPNTTVAVPSLDFADAAADVAVPHAAEVAAYASSKEVPHTADVPHAALVPQAADVPQAALVPQAAD